jgi:hypothetical protein
LNPIDHPALKKPMPPCVAGIFSTAKSRPAAPSVPKLHAEAIRGEVESTDDRTFEVLLSSRMKIESDAPKPKYILAALEKAEERKAMAEILRARRREREIAKLEKQHGDYLRFDTVTGTGDFSAIANTEETATRGRMATGIDSDPVTDFDFTGMQDRYLERLQAKDILKLQLTPAQLKLIVEWVELARDTQAE